MSHDQYPFSYADFGESDVARTRAIAVLSVWVIEEMNKMSQGYPEQYTDKFEYITMGARLSQFDVLASAVVEVARDQVMKEQPFYLIDDVEFHVLESGLKLQENMSEFFNDNMETSREAIERGMRAGTDDFLRMLVPEEVAEATPERIDTYFTPWARNMLRYVQPTYMKKVEDEDGECEVFLPTNLQNIYVAHVYAKGVSIPVEELRLIADPTIFDHFTQPSSQQ